MSSVAVIDYGMGNLRSVYQAFHHVAPNDNVLIAHQPEEIRSADRVVLPGQGAMPDCMRHLQESGLLDALLEASKNKPLLGVCVGEQMLFDKSAEVRPGQEWTPCLGLIPGQVRRFDLAGQKQADGSSYKVPHMGWNQVRQDREHPIWNGIPDLTSFYFVHSYYIPVNAYTTAQTSYGVAVSAAMRKDNFYAVQFHPEKSAAAGLRLLANFVRWQPLGEGK